MKQVYVDYGNGLTPETVSDLTYHQMEYQRTIGFCETKINDFLGLEEMLKFDNAHPMPTEESFFSDPNWSKNLEAACEAFLDAQIPKVQCGCGFSIRLHKNQERFYCPVCGSTIHVSGDVR